MSKAMEAGVKVARKLADVYSDVFENVDLYDEGWDEDVLAKDAEYTFTLNCSANEAAIIAMVLREQISMTEIKALMKMKKALMRK